MSAGVEDMSRAGSVRADGGLMIFHAPFPLQPDRVAASMLRPLAMRRAFADLGYRVMNVTGYAAQRRRAMTRVRAALAAGARIEFVYSENATIPNALTEPRHLPVHPLLDAAFFRHCRRSGVPVGVFYRDVYWRFPRFREGINPVLEAGLQAAYRSELMAFERVGLHLFLPSQAMARHVPHVDPVRMSALPPGAPDVAATRRDSDGWDDGGDEDGKELELLFVGVLQDNYRLDACLRAVSATPGTRVTLCVRQETWETSRDHYAPLLPAGRAQVVHRSGAELEPLYRRADLGVLFTEPNPYWDFAVPYKLYEYLAHELPVIAVRGTQTGRLVEKMGIGWVLSYDAGALSDLLRHLREAPEEIEAVRRRMREVLPDQTWQARARTVVQVLGATERKP
ncbi:glycosyltransferase [uncultured Actinomyces sp.]|uniref:glycosyltransferase n=1 Tax=uncultured Actinomyces sp. TaxID=249061 RepID=UPI0028D7DA3E|nr:glycosyltransferase [uncultured Actinomyces sp.]